MLSARRPPTVYAAGMVCPKAKNAGLLLLVNQKVVSGKKKWWARTFICHLLSNVHAVPL